MQPPACAARSWLSQFIWAVSSIFAWLPFSEMKCQPLES